MSSRDVPCMCKVLRDGLDVPLAAPRLVLVAVVEAVHAAVPVVGPGPRPARPRHVERLPGRGVRTVVLYHGDAVLRASSHLIATPPIGSVATSFPVIPIQS